MAARFRNVRKEGSKEKNAKMAREGIESPTDTMDIVVKEENVEIDKGDDVEDSEQRQSTKQSHYWGLSAIYNPMFQVY